MLLDKILLFLFMILQWLIFFDLISLFIFIYLSFNNSIYELALKNEADNTYVLLDSDYYFIFIFLTILKLVLQMIFHKNILIKLFSSVYIIFLGNVWMFLQKFLQVEQLMLDEIKLRNSLYLLRHYNLDEQKLFIKNKLLEYWVQGMGELKGTVSPDVIDLFLVYGPKLSNIETKVKIYMTNEIQRLKYEKDLQDSKILISQEQLDNTYNSITNWFSNHTTELFLLGFLLLVGLYAYHEWKQSEIVDQLADEIVKTKIMLKMALEVIKKHDQQLLDLTKQNAALVTLDLQKQAAIKLVMNLGIQLREHDSKMDDQIVLITNSVRKINEFVQHLIRSGIG